MLQFTVELPSVQVREPATLLLGVDLRHGRRSYSTCFRGCHRNNCRCGVVWCRSRGLRYHLLRGIFFVCPFGIAVVAAPSFALERDWNFQECAQVCNGTIEFTEVHV